MSWELSRTLPPLLLLILGTTPLIGLEVGHLLPVDLDLVDEALPQAPADGVVGVEVPGEPHEAPGELDLAPDGAASLGHKLRGLN